MPFRFRKQIKLFGGLKANLGKRGLSSFSFGRRGFSLNLGKRGAKTTVGIPGTGVSWESPTIGLPSKDGGQPNADGQPAGYSWMAIGCAVAVVCLVVICLLLAVGVWALINLEPSSVGKPSL